MSKNFKKQHEKGEHKPGKPVNDVADFSDTRYKPVRESGSGHGETKAKGTKPGQIKAVTRDPLNYVGTGKLNKGQDGSSHLLVTGQKGSSGLKPQHLDGKVTKGDDGKYRKGSDVFSSASSETASYWESESSGTEKQL